MLCQVGPEIHFILLKGESNVCDPYESAVEMRYMLKTFDLSLLKYGMLCYCIILNATVYKHIINIEHFISDSLMLNAVLSLSWVDLQRALLCTLDGKQLYKWQIKLMFQDHIFSVLIEK